MGKAVVALLRVGVRLLINNYDEPYFLIRMSDSTIAKQKPESLDCGGLVFVFPPYFS